MILGIHRMEKAVSLQSHFSFSLRRCQSTSFFSFFFPIRKTNYFFITTAVPICLVALISAPLGGVWYHYTLKIIIDIGSLVNGSFGLRKEKFLRRSQTVN